MAEVVHGLMKIKSKLLSNPQILNQVIGASKNRPHYIT